MTYPPSQIVVCQEPKDAFFKVCLTIMGQSSLRNRLVTFAPVYESYQNIPVLLTGQPPILLPTDRHFLPDPKQLEDLLRRDQTIALIVLNSPNNPSGAVYPLGLIQEMAGIIGQHPEVGIISDEVYRTILYDDHQHESIATYLPGQTFVLGGMSKEISGTGFRLGFVAGPETISQTIAIVEGNVSSCVNLPTQKGYAHFLPQDANLQL
ncbi:TPA: aminotransferase class I/II-fold pyridoxal phosphate-dependent enzyme [Candidatus Poribacteria bacterium]|nr:aminotransferase class I/II-fold pyridoxal phosphate-dependent enzyme [Candidatus Poribacteria bacterium]